MTVDEVKKLIEEIQQVLAFVALPDEEEMIDLAARHEEYVQAVTERLQQVETLLEKGLKSEAIDIAEKAPNLNELVTALDFPELAAWNDCLMEFGILPIRELPIDIAESLNDAYSVDAPLVRLLEKYRTQSLARAPVAERIDTLRKLASEDLDNRKWKSDVQKFETYRLSLIKKDLQAAVAARAMDTVASIDRELNGQSWSVKIPAPLKQSAREAHHQLRCENALAELEPLCHALSDAYSAFDEPAGMNLRTRFFALSEIAGLQETDPLYDIAGPALDWLNEAEARAVAASEFRQAVAQLETSLNGNPTIEELERLYAQAVRNENTLPPQLENRLAERIETIRAAQSRKRVTLLATIIGGSLVAIVAVVLVVKTVVFQRLAEGHFAQLQSLIVAAESTGAITPVDDYIDQIRTEDPRFLDTPEILGAVKQFETVRQNENGRLQQMTRLLENALNLGTHEARWENFPEAENALVAAEQIAVNESERAKILQARTSIHTVRAALQKKTDATFARDQEALVEMISALPSDELSGYAAVATTMAELQKRPHVSSELKSALAALKVKVDQQKMMISENLEVARSLQAITSASGNSSRFRSELIKYTQKHPGTQRSEELISVTKSDEQLWTGVTQWNSIRRRFLAVNLKTITPVQAQQLITDFDSFLKSSGPYPGRTDVDDRLKIIKAIGRRSGGVEGSSIEQIERMLAPKTISLAYQVKEKDGLRYFSASLPKVTTKGLTFRCYLTTTGTQLEDMILAIGKVQNAEQSSDAWLAPQTVLSRRLLPVLQQTINLNFESAIIGGVEDIARSDIDAVLKMLLVEKLLTIGSEGSEFIRNRAEQSLADIGRSGVSRLTNWVSARDERAAEERRLAEGFFRDHSEQLIENLKQSIGDQDQFTDLSIGPALICAGWLHRNAQGDWVVALSEELRPSDNVVLYGLGTIDGEPQLYRAATVKQNAAGSLPADNVPPNCREGHPVYYEAQP